MQRCPSRRLRFCVTTLLSLLAVLLLASPTLAQDETLITGGIQSGGFGGPVLKATEVDGAFRVIVGGRGAWVINRTVAFGGGLYWLVTPVESASMPGRAVRMGYGGLEFEHIYKTQKLVHFTSQLMIGAGAAWLTGDGPGSSYDLLFVTEPGFNVELNVATQFRVALGLGYRFVAGSSLPGVDNSDLGGFVVTFTMKSGTF